MGDRDIGRVIEGLTARAERVSPLWPPAHRAAAWLLAGVVVLALGIAGSLRSDLHGRLRDPRFVLDLTSVGVLATLLAYLACLAAVPGRRAGRVAWIVGAMSAAAVLGFTMLHPFDVRQTLAAFVAAGIRCLRGTTLLALIPTGLLLVAVRRGAPVAPIRAGVLAGASGWLLAALFVRLTCPLEEALHLLTWHVGPALLAAACTAGVGAVWLGRWTRPRRIGSR